MTQDEIDRLTDAERAALAESTPDPKIRVLCSPWIFPFWLKRHGAFYLQHMSVDDLRQEVYAILTNAAIHYRPLTPDGKRQRWSTYAVRSVILTMVRVVNTTGLIRSPVSDGRFQYVEQPKLCSARGDDRSNNGGVDNEIQSVPYFDRDDRGEVEHAARRILAVLPDRVREVVKRRYGLDGYRPRTPTQIAADTGYTLSQVRYWLERFRDHGARVADGLGIGPEVLSG